MTATAALRETSGSGKSTVGLVPKAPGAVTNAALPSGKAESHDDDGAHPARPTETTTAVDTTATTRAMDRTETSFDVTSLFVARGGDVAIRQCFTGRFAKSFGG